jgi:branched-chain amino acid transport system ATP-binding protein
MVMNSTQRYVLLVKNVSKYFGKVIALKNVNIEIMTGEVVGLVGPNGAGKTTLLNVISKFYKPDNGRIYVNGFDVTDLPPYKVARCGVSRTFQIPKLLRNLTVKENIQAATLISNSPDAGRLADMLIDLFGLARLLDKPARTLSGGQQKLLEFIMAVVQSSRLVMLDEPVGGLHPEVINLLGEVIKDLSQKDGRSFLIVEHNIPFVAETCKRVYVMRDGAVIAEGSMKEINESVIKAYLGGDNAEGQGSCGRIW